jgi:3-hydroxyacyl-CoA dehydrogenase
MLAAGRTSFYAYDGATQTYWDIASKSARPVATNEKALKIEHLRRGNKKVKTNFGATLWDMGDGAACVEFHTKMNSIDDDVVKMLDEGLTIAERDFSALVVGNDAERFSIGANIFGLMMAARMQRWDDIRALVDSFQRVNQRLRYSPIPVVTAPTGLTLGGGAEVTMAGNAVQASAELYIGLVEVGVGLIPGGSGNLQLLRNVYGPFAADPEFDPMPYLKKVFLTIATAKVATSAEEARDAGFLSPTDLVSMNRDLQLGEAKQRALGLARAGFRPPRKTEFLLPGVNGKATIDMMLYDMQLNGQISAHDRVIAGKLADVLTGGNTSPTTPVTEERLLELEQEAFLSLCGEEKTLERVAHMLEHNKPLRN